MVKKRRLTVAEQQVRNDEHAVQRTCKELSHTLTVNMKSF